MHYGFVVFGFFGRQRQLECRLLSVPAGSLGRGGLLQDEQTGVLASTVRLLALWHALTAMLSKASFPLLRIKKTTPLVIQNPFILFVLSVSHMLGPGGEDPSQALSLLQCPQGWF